MAHPLAGKPPPESLLINPETLRAQYYSERPDVREPEQRVAFGTSGHRGSAARRGFNEAHILAVTQAVCEYRKKEGIDGPLFLGMDTHALSEPAQRTALEVLAAHGVEVRFTDGATPTPVISHAILTYNRGREQGAGRWHRHHALAQPARGRGHQVQPAQRRPGGHGHHRLGREARQ